MRTVVCATFLSPRQFCRRRSPPEPSKHSFQAAAHDDGLVHAAMALRDVVHLDAWTQRHFRRARAFGDPRPLPAWRLGDVDATGKAMRAPTPVEEPQIGLANLFPFDGLATGVPTVIGGLEDAAVDTAELPEGTVLCDNSLDAVASVNLAHRLCICKRFSARISNKCAAMSPSFLSLRAYVFLMQVRSTA
eukprot:CAMPEP_0117619850 /NCGR_PEP_ID=MMETSP0784-20121206/86828_1 /TAXON_ID=39447 /ORGANISM="" /LENGTH=189 /DNA_ID=CAMNT_0005423751 /DNA_START=50 /DNA_END=617 /DNA_ORIENTATION=+